MWYEFKMLKSTRIIPPFAAFLLLLGGADFSTAEATRNAEQLVDFGAVAFAEVRSVSVAQIVDLNTHDRSSATDENFHGCRLTSKWSVVRTQAQAGLIELVKKPIDFWVKTYRAAGDNYMETNLSFCAPDFGYAIRLDTTDGTRDFLVCLRCGQIEAFGNGHTVIFEANDADLVKLKASYVDEFILMTTVTRHAQSSTK
jgi:hypothetical protein